jgi:hypothetical protein
MDAFESIVATILEADGAWVRQSVRVQLQPAKKQKKAAPRTELDVVAFWPASNELWIVECKSFLNSKGVRSRALTDATHKGAKRYKLFHDDAYLAAVTEALLDQLKLTMLKPRMQLCLAAAKIYGQEAIPLRKHFKSKGWRLLGPPWLRKKIRSLAESDYHDDVATMVGKVLRPK